MLGCLGPRWVGGGQPRQGDLHSLTLCPQSLDEALKYCNYVFTIVFVFEAVLKLVAFGFRRFFKDRCVGRGPLAPWRTHGALVGRGRQLRATALFPGGPSLWCAQVLSRGVARTCGWHQDVPCG